MSLFNIQELIEHTESTKQEIRGNWYPVRPKQPSGWFGFKQRVRNAFKILTGKADAVEWSLRPIKKKPVISSDRPTKVENTYTHTLGNNLVYNLPEGFQLHSLKVLSYRETNDPSIAPAKPIPHGNPLWTPYSGTDAMLGQFQTGRGIQITFIYDRANNTICSKGPASVNVEFKVK